MGVHWVSYRIRTHGGLFNVRPFLPSLGYPETHLVDDLRRAAPPLLCRHVGDPSDRCLDRVTASSDERLDGSAHAHSELTGLAGEGDQEVAAERRDLGATA
jgi:hypothetical protein